MAIKITDKVSWVGKIDWELPMFHGHELSTHRGTSYNSYLIRDEKTVLIDTVWLPFEHEFVSRLAKEVALDSIDYIVVNHSEIDHSGSLPELMHYIPDTPIYCTANAEKILRGQYNELADGWNFVNVKTGDTLEIGQSTLTFIEAPYLHWPDTMFTYMSGDNILFSNDGFGQHYATEALFDDMANLEEVYEEAEKYYCNILNIYSKQVTQKINEILALNLPLDMICPSHGILWRKDIQGIVNAYLKWADAYQTNQITIIYDTMWNGTRTMAEALADGIHAADPDVVVKVMNAAIEDKNDILTEVFRSKGIALGAPTVNYGYTHAIAGLLEMIRGAHFKNKKAMAFGSYGWSGNAPKQLAEALEQYGFEMVGEPVKSEWMPDNDEVARLRGIGGDFAKAF